MKLLTTMNRHALLMIFLVTFVLYGCATGESLIVSDQLTIEKSHSDKMHIVYVDVHRVDGETNISGKVKFNKEMIGTPSDYLLVTIIDPDGNVLNTARVRYYRNGKPTRVLDTFKFSITIPEIVPKGSVIRLANENT